MRVLVLYAHPVETSFGAALHRGVLSGLRNAGHTIDDCDLYAEQFDPLLSRAERLHYHDLDRNRAPVASYVERLQAAAALVLVFPVWNYGFPAILKGFFDRVFLPGVSFTLENGRLVPQLRQITKLAAVTSYGGPRWAAILMGDPPRRIVKGQLRSLAHPGAALGYHALYDMNRATQARREAFLARVERTMAGF